MVTDTAKAIIERRQKLGITQSEVARRSGISQPTISDLEAGVAKPRNTTVEQLAKALECDPLDLDPGYAPGRRRERTRRTSVKPLNADAPIKAALDDIASQMMAEFGFTPSHMQVVQFLAKKAGYSISASPKESDPDAHLQS